MSTVFLIVGVVFVLSLIPLVLLGARSYLKYRGTRVVTCPETKGPAAVKLDIAHATKTGASGEIELRVRSCSRWPERQGCGQPCLEELAAAPAECLVKTTLVEWYRGSTCALCGGAIGKVHWVEHKPALLTPGRETVEWNQVSAENIPRMLATHQRVCWNCHVSKALRERLPGLPIEQPEARAGQL
jgi:uncharacterized protein YbaR (Trm112 family)